MNEYALNLTSLIDKQPSLEETMYQIDSETSLSIVSPRIYRLRQLQLKDGIVIPNLKLEQRGLAIVSYMHHVSKIIEGKTESFRVRICRTCSGLSSLLELGSYADLESALLVNDAHEIMQGRYKQLHLLCQDDIPYIKSLMVKRRGSMHDLPLLQVLQERLWKSTSKSQGKSETAEIEPFDSTSSQPSTPSQPSLSTTLNPPTQLHPLPSSSQLSSESPPSPSVFSSLFSSNLSSLTSLFAFFCPETAPILSSALVAFFSGSKDQASLPPPRGLLLSLFTSLYPGQAPQITSIASQIQQHQALPEPYSLRLFLLECKARPPSRLPHISRTALEGFWDIDFRLKLFRDGRLWEESEALLLVQGASGLVLTRLTALLPLLPPTSIVQQSPSLHPCIFLGLLSLVASSLASFKLTYDPSALRTSVDLCNDLLPFILPALPLSHLHHYLNHHLHALASLLSTFQHSSPPPPSGDRVRSGLSLLAYSLGEKLIPLSLSRTRTLLSLDMQACDCVSLDSLEASLCSFCVVFQLSAVLEKSDLLLACRLDLGSVLGGVQLTMKHILSALDRMDCVLLHSHSLLALHSLVSAAVRAAPRLLSYHDAIRGVVEDAYSIIRRCASRFFLAELLLTELKKEEELSK